MSGVRPRIRPGHVAIGVLLALAGVAVAQAPEPAAGGKAPRLVMALYRYDFQGDRRRPGPGRAVWNPDGSSALALHPWESPGPWFSVDRVQYHRNQLQLMANAGIDVALVIYRGDREARTTYALANLTALADALKQHVKDRLAPYKYPREIEFVKELPKTISGKIRRGELRRMELARLAAAKEQKQQ